MAIRSWFIRFSTLLIPKLLYSIQLQLFLSVLAMPLLIAWGLPISIMSYVGNIIFSPFLFLFLLISCCIFFLELFSLPNSWLIYSLELVTKVWAWLIAQGSPSWLIYFAKPPLFVLLAIPVGGFLIMQYKKLKKPLYSLLCLLFFLVTISLLLKYGGQQKIIIKKISCNNGFVTVIKAGNTVTLIDPGVMGQRIATSWVEYTLLKELSQTFGTTALDTVVCTKPGVLTFDYMTQLCQFAKITNLYLLLWEGNNEKNLLRSYGRLRHGLQQKNVQLMRIKKTGLTTIELANNIHLKIDALPQQLAYKETSYPALHISLCGKDLPENLDIFSTGYMPK